MSTAASDLMWAAEGDGPGSVRLAQLPIPACADDEVRVRIEACGICGSDLHFYRAGGLIPGRTPGHEMAGRIDAVGRNVAGLREGDAVAVEPIHSCGACEMCRTGRHNICREMQLYGLHRSGGFAEYISVPATRVHAVADDLPPAIAALAEPVAVAVHGLARGRLESGQRVLVQGCGAIGLVSLIAARALGAGEVWVSARHAHQAELARSLGATRVLREEESTPAALAERSREVDIDLVVETVGGSADTVRAACAAIRPGGVVSVLGVFFGPVEVDPYALLLKEGTLAWSNCYGAHPGPHVDFRVASDLVDAERETLARLVTHERPLSEIASAFETAADKHAGSVKVSVLPGA